MKNLSLADIRTSGLNLIEASAGTGKTWTIAALYMRLLLEREMRPENILVVTYTRAATAELKERIRHRIVTSLELFTSKREARDELETVILKHCPDSDQAVRILTRALFSFDDSAIFTIHGFCQRALAENAFESGSLFDTDMITDQSALVQEVADDYWRTRILTEQEGFLGQLVSAGYTPAKLLGPLAGHFQTPDLRIIPEAAANLDFSTLSEQREIIFRQAAVQWRNERDIILALLKRPGLNQQSYKPPQIDNAAILLDNWFSGNIPSQPCDKLSLFTSANLEKKSIKGNNPPEHPFFELCQELAEACSAADTAFEQKVVAHQSAMQQWLQEELPRRKRRQNLRCYDDLLLDLQKALEGNGGEILADRLRERFQAALIDEFQDTDPLQWRIFQRLGEEADYPLFLIGDPKQAIYSFRGADIFAYLSAADAVTGDMRWTLDTNRRSAFALVEAVNTLFKSSNNPFLCDGVRFNAVQSGRSAEDQLLINGMPDDKPLRFLVYPNHSEKPLSKEEVRKPIADSVATEIARLLNGGNTIRDSRGEHPLGPGDVAVLVRTHVQADLIRDALANLDIPAVQHGNMTIFDTPEALDILRILRAVAEPSSEMLAREALLGGLMGVNADILADLLENDDGKWEEWLGCFRKLNASYRSDGIVGMAACLLEECNVKVGLLSLPDGERRLTNLLHCVELIHQTALETGAGIEGSIAWLEKRITGHQEDETALLRLETDENAVRIATIHASKGLEYPILFIPFAWDFPAKAPDRVLFHDDDGTLTLDLGSEQYDQHRLKTKAERDAEAARLLYVALTRAEFRCYVVWGGISQAEASPLCNLLHDTSSIPFIKFGNNDIIRDLKELEQKEVGVHVSQLTLDASIQSYQPNEFQGQPFICREFRGQIPGDWRVSSFSAIAGATDRQLQPRDHDADSPSADFTTLSDYVAAEEGDSIYCFPRGAAAGTCLHELFERLDYSTIADASLEQLTRSCLLRNGYDRRWMPAVQGMVSNVTSAKLITGEAAFSLAQLKPGSWQTEMEFFLPLGRLNSSRLREVFSGLLSPALHGDFEEILSKLQVQETRGMLLGFMDMVFEHNGRYYIIDWKSNHLGNRQGDYSQDSLREAMARHSYILQYHLYTLALDRLLRLRLPDYNYATHFGGAIYVFLRGVSANNPDLGIYRDRPSEEFVRRANEILLAKGVLNETPL